MEVPPIPPRRGGGYRGVPPKGVPPRGVPKAHPWVPPEGGPWSPLRGDPPEVDPTVHLLEGGM